MTENIKNKKNKNISHSPSKFFVFKNRKRSRKQNKRTYIFSF